MGNQTSPQLQQAINRQNQLDQTSFMDKFLISPDQNYAIKKTQKLTEAFPDVMKAVNTIKVRQNCYLAVTKIVKDCPIYELTNLKCWYQGQWLDCLPHGCGIAVYQNKSYYEGDFQKGELKSEEGLYFFNNDNSLDKKQDDTKSSYYIGQFLHSKFHGQGKIFHKGVFYEGAWIDGKREGKGNELARQSNSDYRFEGTYVNGFKDGDGLYTRQFKDKIYVYDGQFKNGTFNGEGKIIIDNSQYYKGNFKNGNLQGFGQLHLLQGTFRGHFINNCINGSGKFIFNDNSKSVIEGKFSEDIDCDHSKIKIYCDGELVVEDNYYSFPIYMAKQ